MTVTVITDVYSAFRKGKIYALAGTTATVIAAHGHVLILENSSGRFPVKVSDTDYEAAILSDRKRVA